MRGSARKASLGAIFLTVFLDLLGFGLVLPFLAEEAVTNFATRASIATLLASVYSLMQFLFVPVWGRLSDRIGRRPVLLWSVAATAVGMSGLGMALVFGSSVGWLFGARIFSGIATANLGTASAYIADVTKPEDRAKGMGLIGMAFGLGFIFGPAVGGLLADIPIHGRNGALPCFVAAGLSVVNVVWVALGLGESLPAEKRAIASGAKRRLSPLDLAATRRTLAIPALGRAILVNFIVVLSFTSLDQTFRLFNAQIFGMDRKATGLALAFIGVIAALTQGGLVRPLSKRLADATLMRVGVGLQVVAFAGLALSPSLGKWALYLFGAVLAVGNGASAPSSSAYVSRRAPPNEQGATLGVNQSFSSLARMLGPAFGGFLYDYFNPGMPYVAAAIGMVLALYVALTLPSAPPDQVESRLPAGTPIVAEGEAP
jgi:DHA1 family tetracycline resistance protein-like MFS transporter